MMRGWKLGSFCAALLLTATIGSSAIAQDAAGQAPAARPGGGQGFGQGRGGFGGAPTLSNLPLPYLTWALSLTDDQKTKIQTIQDKARTDMQELRKPDANGQRPDRATLAPKIKDLNDQAKKDIEAVLTSDQTKKTETVLKEAGNYNAVGIPLAVVPDLKLTDEEKTKLTDIAMEVTKGQEAMQKDLTAARTAQDQAKMQELMQTARTARTAAHDKALGVLTEAQKTAITDYEKAHPRGNRGGGQRPGAGAGNA